jgi:hypothetical protein
MRCASVKDRPTRCHTEWSTETKAYRKLTMHGRRKAKLRPGQMLRPPLHPLVSTHQGGARVAESADQCQQSAGPYARVSARGPACRPQTKRRDQCNTAPDVDRSLEDAVRWLLARLTESHDGQSILAEWDSQHKEKIDMRALKQTM